MVITSDDSSPSSIVQHHTPKNYSNSYYLQIGDHPGVILISQPLNGDYYLTWNRSMSMALIVKNKSCFVNGALPLPAKIDPLYDA